MDTEHFDPLTCIPAHETFFVGKKDVPCALPPALAPLADSHTHLTSLHHIDPAYAMARAAVAGVRFMVTVVDPTDDATDPGKLYDDLAAWEDGCEEILKAWCEAGVVDALGEPPCTPRVRMLAGCHPHNARLFDDDARSVLQELLSNSRCSGVGEIGLDYHYDLSPRDVQLAVFKEQLELACELNAPLSLHIREAHKDAFALMKNYTLPAAGTILHCFDLGYEDAEPFLNLGCLLGIGGAVTFGRSDNTRAAVCTAGRGRILTETDAPYMAPEPLRGTRCEPAYIAITTRFIADMMESAGLATAKTFYEDAYEDCCAIFDGEPPVQK